MSVVGTVPVECPACGRPHEVRIVQSINAATQPDDKRALLAGQLNVLACDCGRRSQLAATVVYHDPDRAFWCQVVPHSDDEAEVERAAALFRAAGATGTVRIVPSLNALVEKVAILEAGLLDWALELAKVLLLSSLDPPDLDRVLLFAGLDREAFAITWLRFDAPESPPKRVASPLGPYDRLAARAATAPSPDDVQIDRAWAVEAAEALITAQN